MGPFPHDTATAAISAYNPAGTDGFEFVEFAGPDVAALAVTLAKLGFTCVGAHSSRPITLWRQGGINFVLNDAPDTPAARFAAEHGPGATAMAWRVVDAGRAYERAIRLGAEPYTGPGKTLDVPAIVGIGGSLIYFVDRYGEKGSPYSNAFCWIGDVDTQPVGAGFFYIDHLTHNVRRGSMEPWYRFYADVFGFREIRFFNIEGKLTGLTSRALTSPCGKIRIPINESVDERSQIEEFIRLYKGEGIQHIALGTRDIYAGADRLAGNGVAFMPGPPATYYERSRVRVKGHGEPLAEMMKHGILIDGEGVVDGGATRILLQVFTKPMVGPIFFELIQRKGDDGFGEGNFKALFESIEEDQIQRGVLKV